LAKKLLNVRLLGLETAGPTREMPPDMPAPAARVGTSDAQGALTIYPLLTGRYRVWLSYGGATVMQEAEATIAGGKIVMQLSVK
jgi:hypothetical protein